MEGGRGPLFRGDSEQRPTGDSSGVLQAALNAAEEEANAVRAWLAESNAVVAGKMSSMNISSLVFVAFVLIFFYNCQLKRCN